MVAALVLNAGPAGVQLVPQAAWAKRPGLKAAADVNAVPPLGIEGIETMDDGAAKQGVGLFVRAPYIAEPRPQRGGNIHSAAVHVQTPDQIRNRTIDRSLQGSCLQLQVGSGTYSFHSTMP